MMRSMIPVMSMRVVSCDMTQKVMMWEIVVGNS